MPGFSVFASFRGKETSDLDTKYVFELGKMSSLTYEKLADHDRIPLSVESTVPGGWMGGWIRWN